MNREELDRYLRKITPREKEILKGISLEELHRQDTCRFAKSGQGTYLFEGSLFMAPGRKNCGKQAGPVMWKYCPISMII